MSGKIVSFTGADDSNVYVRRDRNDNVVIAGNLTISGELIMDNADISNTTGLITYQVGATNYPLYPSFVKICSTGTITKQGTATIVSEASITIPVDGYYSITAQAALSGIAGGTAATDTITMYADLAGGSLSPISGATNTFNVVPNATNSFFATTAGLIQQKFVAGDVINVYHLEAGSYTFSSGTIKVAYKYEGNKAI